MSVLHSNITIPSPLGGGNNRCWFRTSIQVLLSCPSFIKTLMSQQDQLTQKNDTIALTFLKMVTDPNNIDQYQYDLINIMSKIHPIFTSGSQEDAGQAITLIIDNIKDDTIKKLFTIQVEHIIITHANTNILINTTNHTTLEMPTIPISSDTVHQPQALAQAHHNFLSTMLISYNTPDSPNTQLQDHPDKPYIAKHAYRITHISKIMIFTNTSQFREQRNKQYYFPATYKLKNTNNTDYIFNLMGIGIYSGSGTGGHWYAQGFRKSPNSSPSSNKLTWYQLNDSHISPINNHAINKLWLIRPMILIYCRDD